MKMPETVRLFAELNNSKIHWWEPCNRSESMFRIDTGDEQFIVWNDNGTITARKVK